MSLAAAMESWCDMFKDTTSEVDKTVRTIEKYVDTVVKEYSVSRQAMSAELRAMLKAQRNYIKEQVGNMLDGYSSDLSAASAILAKMRNG